jgi:hypothetical protein
MSMNHEDAIESMAVERYILGELHADDRDAFEEHFFSCSKCSASMTAAAKLSASVRLGIPHGAALPRSRMNWWAAASVVLAGALGYQTVVVPRIAEDAQSRPQQAARILTPQMLTGDTRGALPVVNASPGEPVLLNFPLFAQPGAYRGEILDAKNRQVAPQFDVPPVAPDEQLVPLYVGPGTLHSGNYTLVIRGTGGNEVATYQFEVRLR